MSGRTDAANGPGGPRAMPWLAAAITSNMMHRMMERRCPFKLQLQQYAGTERRPLHFNSNRTQTTLQ
eukprot:15436153-Alexandrium_andersonii.AAC.1